MDFVRIISAILTDSKHTRWIAPCLIIAEAVLCGLVIWKVPYTEIDYTTYLAQASKFLHGERNYSKIDGPSGPLVYPAIHVYIYSVLHWLTVIPDPDPSVQSVGVDIRTAQIVFAGLYLLTLAVALKCYRNINAPPWLLACLVLSKRMHSIFLLRLFNDAWATLAFWLSVLLLQKGRRGWFSGPIIWSLGLGIKMTLLLAAPAVGVILVQAVGLGNAIWTGSACLAVQIIAAQPFLASGFWKEYVSRAFEFSRVFLYKWTVNWRFVDEDTFLSKEFAVGLLVMHVSLLLLFLHWKWVRLSSKGLPDFLRKYLGGALSSDEQERISRKVTPTYVMDTMLGSLIIGILCARSLHYQFYAYLGWATPYLLWRAAGNPAWVVLNWAIQEYCWLVFPSTTLSSALVVSGLTLQVVSTLIAPPVDHISPPSRSLKEKSVSHK